MSPDKKKKLNILRKELDILDNKLIKIIKIRTNIVKKVLKLKTYKNEIVDKKRISIILRNIKKKSIKNNIDPKITHKIWKNMIICYVEEVFFLQKLHAFLLRDYIFLLLILP